MAAFLERLRTLGIYDSSMIIISSDHGTGLQPTGFKGTSDSLALSRGPSNERLATIAGAAKALMLIKPSSSNGALVISEAPTSHTDLQPTILDLLNLRADSTGTSMFQRDRARSRARSFGMYNLRERFPSAYLTRLDELVVDGPLADAGAWGLKRSIWRPDMTLDAREVDIGARSGSAYVGPGWTVGQRESVDQSGAVTFVRALTRQAVLFASLPAAAGEIVLRAAWPADRAPRSVGVDIDGRTAARLNLSNGNGYRDLSIAVPADPARPSISHITLRFETDDPGRFVFKLDRLAIRGR